MRPHHLFLLLALGCNEEPKDTDTDPVTETDDTDGTTDTDDTDGMGDTDGMDTDDTDAMEPMWPATEDDYVVSGATLVSSWVIPADATDCCRDWGAISKAGAGVVDNALVAMVNGLSGFLDDDVQTLIDGAVAGGAFLLVLDHIDLPDADGDYRMAAFTASFDADVGTTWEDAEAGTGSFVLGRDNFVTGTGEPTTTFASVSRTGDTMLAEGGAIDIFLPFGLVDLVLPVSDVTLTADITPSADGVAAANGSMSGYVTVDDLFGAMNQVVDASCGCLGRTTQLFSKTGATWGADCQADAADLCMADEEEVCRSLAGGNILAGGLCNVVPPLMTNVADLDLDDTVTGYEALSIGLNWSGVNATVTGVAPAQ
jgi:hypothetical protein